MAAEAAASAGAQGVAAGAVAGGGAGAAQPHPAAAPSKPAPKALSAGAQAGARPQAAGAKAQAGATGVVPWVPQSEASAFPWASPAPLGRTDNVAVGAYFVQFAVVLVLLLGLLWVSGKLARGRWKDAGGLGSWGEQLSRLGLLVPSKGAPTDLRLEHRLPLDAERTAYVVACEGQRWLLAAGPGALTVVAELEPRPAEGDPDKAGGFTTAVDNRMGPGGQG